MSFQLEVRGPETRILIVGPEHGHVHGMVHVVTDQIHQLEGAHAEPGCFLHQGVDRGRIGPPVPPQSLSASPLKRARHPVDDKAGR